MRLLREGTLLRSGQGQPAIWPGAQLPQICTRPAVPWTCHLMTLVSSVSDVNIVLIFHSSATSRLRLNRHSLALLETFRR